MGSPMHRANDEACARRRRTVRGRRRGRTRRARSDGRGGRAPSRSASASAGAQSGSPSTSACRSSMPAGPHAKTWRCARCGVTRASSSSAAAGESAGSGCQCVRSPGRPSASRSAVADAAVSVRVPGWNSSAASRPVPRRCGRPVRRCARSRGDVPQATKQGSRRTRSRCAPSGSPAPTRSRARRRRPSSSVPSGGAMPRYEPYDTTSSPASRLRAAEGGDRRTAAGRRVAVGAPFDALDAGAGREAGSRRPPSTNGR